MSNETLGDCDLGSNVELRLNSNLIMQPSPKESDDARIQQLMNMYH